MSKVNFHLHLHNKIILFLKNNFLTNLKQESFAYFQLIASKKKKNSVNHFYLMEGKILERKPMEQGGKNGKSSKPARSAKVIQVISIDKY